MSSKSQPDLMAMFQYDQELVIRGFQKFVNDVFDGNDEEPKKKLCESLHEIITNCHCSKGDKMTEIKTESSISRKRSKTRCKLLETKKEKKLKIEPARKLELPSEIWLKIMNCLNTKDLMTNFALVCKNFNNFVKDVKYLQLKNITDIRFESALKLLKTTKHLKEISVSIKSEKAPETITTSSIKIK